MSIEFRNTYLDNGHTTECSMMDSDNYDMEEESDDEFESAWEEERQLRNE